MNDRNNLDTKVPLRNLRAAEREKYSFNAATGQTEAEPEGEKVTSIVFPGLEVFSRSVTTKLIEF